MVYMYNPIKQFLMATIKIKFRPSSANAGEGTIYYQIIHNRVARQIKTGYRVMFSEWEQFYSEPPATNPKRAVCLAALKRKVAEDTAKLEGIIVSWEHKGAIYTSDDVVTAFLQPDNGAATFFSFMRSEISRMKKLGRHGIAEDGVSYLYRSEAGDHTGGMSEQVITLYPKEEICTYTYEIRRVTNLKSTTQLCGSLSGLAHGLFMGTEEIEHERVTVPFEAVSDGVSTVTGKFLTFGHCASHDPHTIFTLYVWMKDGKKLYYTFDVTDQVDNAPDPRHVHIIIDGLDLPQPIEDGDGFHVDIDDWQVVNEDILM